MRTGMLLLGLALGVLWMSGVAAHATPWLTWLDLIVALASVIAAIVRPAARTTEALAFDPEGGYLGSGDSSLERGLAPNGPRVFRVPPIATSCALFVLWAIGLASTATPFLTWWTLAFGVGYGLLALLSGARVPADQAMASGRSGPTVPGAPGAPGFPGMRPV